MFNPGVNNPPADDTPDTPLIMCFKEHSQILCMNTHNNQEEYITVQNLQVGTLVKTGCDGFKAIVNMTKSSIFNKNVNDQSKINKQQLYCCSNEIYDELFEDLIITGSHSILVDSITDEQKN